MTWIYVLLFGFCTIFTTEAQVCVCPRVESFYVYARPTYAVAQSPIAHHGCLGTTGFDGEWYTVNADGREGFVNESEVVLQKNCGPK